MRRQVLRYLWMLREENPAALAGLGQPRTSWTTLRHLATFGDYRAGGAQLVRYGWYARISALLYPATMLAIWGFAAWAAARR